VIDQHDAATALAGLRGAHHAGRAGADDRYIEVQGLLRLNRRKTP
jgi:hypothetical protein